MYLLFLVHQHSDSRWHSESESDSASTVTRTGTITHSNKQTNLFYTQKFRRFLCFNCTPGLRVNVTAHPLVQFCFCRQVRKEWHTDRIERMALNYASRAQPLQYGLVALFSVRRNSPCIETVRQAEIDYLHRNSEIGSLAFTHISL